MGFRSVTLRRRLSGVSNDLISMRSLIGASMAVFAVGGIVGAVSAAQYSDQIEKVFQEVERFLGGIARLPAWGMVAVIFANNLVKAAAALFGGIVAGIGTVYFLFVNGFILGALWYDLASEYPYALVAGSIAPHGIFELFAIFVAGGGGLRLGRAAVSRIVRRSRAQSLRQEIQQAARIFLFFIAPFLLIAAAVETFITPLVVRIWW